MRVEQIRVARVPLTLVAPLSTSTGVHASRVACLVEVRIDGGVIGWGENVAPEGDFYTGETAARSLEATREMLIPRLVDSDDVPFENLCDSWWGVDGWRMAKHSLESALWDANCRLIGEPLATALGGGIRTVRVGVVVGLHGSIGDTIDECLARVGEGYTRVKVKIEPGRDLEVARAARSSLPQGVDLHLDANGAYGPDDIDNLVKVCDEGVALIEQPFGRGDLGSHARLARETSALVCLDESIETRDDLKAAIDAGACGSLNVKPSRVGGFAEAKWMLEMCRANGIAAWVGGMLESGIGRAGALALSTHPACTLTPDLSASSRYFASDVTAPFVLTGGSLEVPAGPGLGLAPLPEVLSRAGTTIETLFER